MLDVFFISQGEENAEDNYQRLSNFVPMIKEVRDVVGIYEVHKQCAIQSETDHFYVVDADAYIEPGFKFNYKPNPEILHWGNKETDCVIVWNSRNPVNDLEYGYGGVKLFPKKPFLENRPWEIDLSTTIGASTVAKEEISCETRFNATPDSAFIGAFRECAKLTSLNSVFGAIKRRELAKQKEIDNLEEHINNQEWNLKKRSSYRGAQRGLINEKYKESLLIYNYFNEVFEATARYHTWSTVSTGLNAKWVIAGAKAGVAFGLQYANSNQMNLINNWTWLEENFNNVNI
jgi:hypothetical protein